MRRFALTVLAFAVVIAAVPATITLVIDRAEADGAVEHDAAPASIDTVFRGASHWPVIGDFAAFNELIRGDAWIDESHNRAQFEIEGATTSFRCVGVGSIIETTVDANGCQAVRGNMRLACGNNREIVGAFDHNACLYGFAAGLDTLTGSIISFQFDLSNEQLDAQSRLLASQAASRPRLLEPRDYLIASGFDGKIYGFGTGFAITDDGVILTAAHVIEQESRIEVRSGNRTAQAHVLAIDEAHDLALLKTDLAFDPLPLMTTDPGAPNSMPVKAIGYHITPRTTPTQISVTATAQDLVAYHLFVFPGDIIPGYSGGPVLSLANHKVIGVIFGVTVQYRSFGWNDYDIEKVVLATDQPTILEFVRAALGASTFDKIVQRSNAAQQVQPFDASDSIVLVTIY